MLPPPREQLIDHIKSLLATARRDAPGRREHTAAGRPASRWYARQKSRRS